MRYGQLTGLLLLAVPVLLIWFLFMKPKGPRTDEANQDGWDGVPLDDGTDEGDGSD
jgi:hypothetical protein